MKPKKGDYIVMLRDPREREAPTRTLVQFNPDLAERTVNFPAKQFVLVGHLYGKRILQLDPNKK